mmetsp:Transcript_14858/g.33166  ORF Transcript_14858/g.33166 Transcript_14858/m.33166 type:complete len:761 (+) Transcript_14858:291-2573(+)
MTSVDSPAPVIVSPNGSSGGDAGRPPLSGGAAAAAVSDAIAAAVDASITTSTSTSSTPPSTPVKLPEPATDESNTIVPSPSDSPSAAMFESKLQGGAEVDDSVSSAEPGPALESASTASGSQDTTIAAAAVGIPQDLSTKPLKVLFLSSDTGGGHRASALSLANQFEILFPGSTYDLLDVVASDGVPPYNSLTSWYSHLSGHPAQWKLVYGVSNSKAFELMADVHLKIMCERAMRRRILSYEPDVVVSVHPLMCNVPALACKKIEKKTGRHLPMFTVVTDLGSAHCLWFANTVDKVYVASEACANLARQRGKVPDDKIIKIGLPIRNDFAVHATAMGNDRGAEKAVAYRMGLRESLSLNCTNKDHRVVLVMGGGEGCGALGKIVDALYVELLNRNVEATVVVICGRNAALKSSIDTRDWDSVLDNYTKAKAAGGGQSWLDIGVVDGCGGKYVRLDSGGDAGSSASASLAIKGCIMPSIPSAGCIETKVTKQIRRILSNTTLENALSSALPASETPSEAVSDGDSAAGAGDYDESVEDVAAKGDANEGRATTAAAALASIESPKAVAAPAEDADDGPIGHVSVLGLGFVTNMAEYMVAADVLVSKAGPGTIAEAASVSLPVMLTSFLPGQEEGNVDFVVDNGFGAFVSDSDPMGVAEVVASWLLDTKKMKELSQAASVCGAPNAAAEIVKSIGEETLKWRETNRKNDILREEKRTAGGDTDDTIGDGQRIGSSLKRLYYSFSNLSGVEAEKSKEVTEIVGS